MARKLAVYGAGLIALYLFVNHASGAGTVISAGANGGSTVIKSLQGR